MTIRIIDRPSLYIAWHRGIWRFAVKQYPRGVKSFLIGALEISFPEWRNG